MNILSAAFLGLVQGLTEFLPVSSSGHLVIAQNLMNFKQPGVLFDVTLHLATAMAVIIYFRKEILTLKPRMIGLLILGTIPAGLAGVLFQDQVEALFLSTKLVGVALLVTAVMNFYVDRQEGRREKVDSFDAAVVGIAQAIAIIPGISRSGSTIFAATQMNVDRRTAAKFSFLLSIPAILGAGFVQFISHGVGETIIVGPYLVGFVVAFASGLVAIHLVLQLLVEKRFKYFGFYAAIIGAVSLLLL